MPFAMSMDILSKNKPALTLAGVTIFGAVIFAATTGTGSGPTPAAEEVAVAAPVPAPSAAPTPAEPVTSFADMVGEYEPDGPSGPGSQSGEMAMGPDALSGAVPANGGFASDTPSSVSGEAGSPRPRQARTGPTIQASAPRGERVPSAVGASDMSQRLQSGQRKGRPE